MNESGAAARLKAFAYAAGFDFAGVAALGPAATGNAYLRWLERGDQAGMAWLERNVDLRLDPRGLLPGARSALVVALRYSPLAGEEEPATGDLWPRVARYARGTDYHDLIRQRLEGVVESMAAEWPQERCRVCVDTAPLLERELAARAGLGAVGKNGNLIHPEAGSYVLLGELLTTLALAPDAPVADLCGECTQCLEACPTGALPEPYRLDARRCLSYWTIEHRGPVPESLRPEMRDWVFGCDVCQAVCPWNRPRGAPAEHPELRLPPERRELDLAGLLGLPESAYRGLFRGSPMKRAKLEGLKRNAAYAAAGSAQPRLRDALVRALAEESEVVREAAAWALGATGTVLEPAD